MSVLVVGLSHRSAPLELVERLSITDFPEALGAVLQASSVGEAVVLSTCNRVEVYAAVSRFHGGVQEISELLSALSGVPLDELTEHLYVHYEERAVQHLFTVACGLDSMVVGEGQILGQIRSAYRVAQDSESAGRLLGELFRHALRVGKRARTETSIGRAGASLVGVGLQVARDVLGDLVGRPVLVVGAGAMGRLAGQTLRREGAGEILVANRTQARAEELAEALGGTAVGLADLTEAIAKVDLVVSSTGAAGVVVPADAVGPRDRPLFVLDLALPRDVDPAVRGLPDVTLVDMEALQRRLGGPTAGTTDVEEVLAIVADEVAAFLGWQRSVRVAPTVTALRAKADALVAAELDRLAVRLPDLGEKERAEVAQAVRRVVEKLLHAPTVRVKELAESPGGDSYAEALRELFELDPHIPETITVADLPLVPDPR